MEPKEESNFLLSQKKNVKETLYLEMDLVEEEQLIRMESGIFPDAPIDKMSRDSLKNLCKAHGVKANLSTEEMKKVLKKLSAGNEVNVRYFTSSWLSNNKGKIVTSSFGTIVVFLIIMFIIFLSPGKSAPLSVPISSPSNFTM